MTRLVFVDDTLVILLESDLPAAALVEAIQSGDWQPPAQLSALLTVPGSAPSTLRPLRVVHLERLVIVSPAHELDPALHPAPHGLTPLTLSPRQRQVLQALADGRSSKQIAADLGLHHRTVGMHLAAIKHRFGTNSTMQSVARGVALGLCKIKPDPKETPDIGYTCPIERGPTRPHPPRNDHEERTLPDPPDQ